MKKLLIVNNNMEIGGVQKSLLNLLQEIHGAYDVSLLLFQPAGEYLPDLPADVHLIPCTSLFRTLGLSQRQSKSCASLYLWRGFLALLTRLLGRRAAMGLILASQPVLPEHYDSAIAFLHNGGSQSFYGGCCEFVLEKVRASRKIGFLHCDYRSCGADHPYNNALYRRFDRIAACSDGCRAAFLQVLPELAEKTQTVTNCHNFAQIRHMAAQDPVCWPQGQCHLLSVARLSPEKGIDRALRAVACAAAQGLPVRYHIVGDGPQRGALEALCDSLGIRDRVEFCGNTANPYRYMASADLLLIPSRHEAAPLVIDEAMSLALPVLSTRTTSSQDMIVRRGIGWVCENDQTALEQSLLQLLRDGDKLTLCQNALRRRPCNNEAAVSMFKNLTEFHHAY